MRSRLQVYEVHCVTLLINKIAVKHHLHIKIINRWYQYLLLCVYTKLQKLHFYFNKASNW